MHPKNIAAACAAVLACGLAHAADITLPTGYTAAYGAVYDPATDTSFVAIAADSRAVSYSDAWRALNDIAAAGGPQGWMATIYSAQENAAVADGYASRGLDLWGYRIGAVRGDDGNWFWNGNANEPLVYTNWAPGQPDNRWGNQSLSRFDHDGQWDDTDADIGYDAINDVHYNLGFVAEFAGNVTVSAVPEPAPWALMLGGVAGLAALARRRAKA